jgi:hypothetical protein
MINWVFDFDVRFIGMTPGEIRYVDPLDQESLPLNAVTNVSPVRRSHLRMHFPTPFN